MPAVPLKNQIIEWLKNQPYWFQFAGNQLLERYEIDSTLVETTYGYFQEDQKLKEPISERATIIFNEIEVIDVTHSNNLNLLSITDIENVNALAVGQRIEINKQLTIIYGNNGSGKSGYIRLLNNAFNSRGDKRILKNVYNTDTGGEPYCKFIFQSTAEPYEKVFPTDKNNFEFSQYSVFDTQSVKVHLDGDNQLNFIPSGFELFEKVLQLLEALKAKLHLDITAKRFQNNFAIHFQNENPIKKSIADLGIQSNEDELNRLGLFTEDDANKLEDIKAKIETLRGLNVQAQITELEKLKKELTTFTQGLQAILDCLTNEKNDYYLGLIDSFHKFQAISKAQGIKSLEQYHIDLIGGSEWRDFIVAAKNYTVAIEQNRQATALYPADKDLCVLCLQPLTEKENTLINSYWQFLKSEAEQELNRTIQKIKDSIKELRGHNPIKFDDTTSLFVYLNSFFPDLVAVWKVIVVNSESARQNIIKNLDNLNKDLAVTSFTNSTNEFDTVASHIKKEIDELFSKKPDQEIASLTFQRNLLTDKSLLEKLLPQILEFISAHKWAALAEQALSALKTNSITTFQGSLFTQHITDKYREAFIEECDKLNAPKVVEVVQQNAKVKTSRKLNVAKQTVSQVLSEGEQRAISLADFLTEVQLNPDNRGVIFDDPVTSLDHLRRALIAKRLVNLSATKQVIIFTHDLLFVNFLKSSSVSANIELQCNWIENLSNQPGIVSVNKGPTTESDYKTIKYANEAWESSRIAEPDERERILKAGFASLRTNYEYLIIFDLFKEVVQRFDERVSVERLKDVVVLPTFTDKLIKKVALLSKYIEAHLHSDTFVSTKPTSEDLKIEIDEFQGLKKELKELREKVLRG